MFVRTGNKRTRGCGGAAVVGAGRTEASLLGLTRRLTTGPMSQSPSHPSVSLGGLAGAQG